MTTEWEPILDGHDREQALERTREIALAVAELGRARTSPELETPGLAGGKAGAALTYAYIAGADLGGEGLADELLGESVDAVAESLLGASLYAGFTGIAWVAEHLAGAPGDADEEDGNQEIDAVLLEHVGHIGDIGHIGHVGHVGPAPWVGDYDLVVGLAGFAVYALERIEHGRESGKKLLEQIIERLHETAVEVPGSPGATWWTSPHLMIDETAKQNPNGYYNCGLAHGSPGVIAVLGAAIAAGVAVDRARPLLERGVRWLLAQRSGTADGPQFPYTVSIPPAAEPRPRPWHSVRAAWCYGDPGVAVALLWAGQCAGEPRWIETGLEVARIAARRPEDKVGVIDAGLCHGAAGLALVYDRIFQATGDQAMRDAAVLWARRTMAMHQPGVGVGGYLSYVPMNKEPWVADPGLLTGSAGIALALLACATANEPRWDRFLLTSARPR